jgi:hypothetical protein
MSKSVWNIDGVILTGRNGSVWRKTCPITALSTTNTVHMMAWEQSQTSLATGRQLTASDMAQPSPSVILLSRSHLFLQVLKKASGFCMLCGFNRNNNTYIVYEPTLVLPYGHITLHTCNACSLNSTLQRM